MGPDTQERCKGNRLQRNRLAAEKYRVRKRKEMREADQRLEQLEEENMRLEEENMRLEEENMKQAMQIEILERKVKNSGYFGVANDTHDVVYTKSVFDKQLFDKQPFGKEPFDKEPFNKDVYDLHISDSDTFDAHAWEQTLFEFEEQSTFFDLLNV